LDIVRGHMFNDVIYNKSTTTITWNNNPYSIPKNVALLDAPSQTMLFSSLETDEQRKRNRAITAGVDYLPKMFSGSLLLDGASNFGNTKSEVHFTILHSIVLYELRLSPIELRTERNMNTALLADIDSLLSKSVHFSPQQWVNKWGTHFVSSVCVGGLVEFTFTVEKNIVDQDKEFNLKLQAEVDQLCNTHTVNLSNVDLKLNQCKTLRIKTYGGHEGKLWFELSEFIKEFPSWKGVVINKPVPLQNTMKFDDYSKLFPTRVISAFSPDTGTQLQSDDTRFLSEKESQQRMKMKEEYNGYIRKYSEGWCTIL